ncbi:Chloride channel voltage gated [Trinorchestia longiramus]|nr:Chloride channel voltage gated [Trinorchestia longiramus]
MEGARWKRWRPSSEKSSSVTPRYRCRHRDYPFPSSNTAPDLEERISLCSPPNRPQTLVTTERGRRPKASPETPRRTSVRFSDDVERQHRRRKSPCTRTKSLRRELSRTSSEEEGSLSDSSVSSSKCVPLLRPSKTRLPPRTPDVFHDWTSKQLRDYLVKKAQFRLEPQSSFESDYDETDLSFSSNEGQGEFSKKNSASSSPATTPRVVDFEQGLCGGVVSATAADIYRGRVGYRTHIGQRGSHQLERVCEWYDPRPRLWSLPTIIVTKWDLSNSGDRLGGGADDHAQENGKSMQYLTVPEPFQVPDGAKGRFGMRRSSSCTDLRGGEDYGASSSIAQANAMQLGSILALMPSAEDDSDPGGGEVGSSGNASVLHYEHSYMYGRYSADLAEYAYTEGKRLRDTQERLDDLTKELHPYKGEASRFIVSFVRPIWNHTFARIGEDWVFLFILGVVMAFVSFGIDVIIGLLFKARMYSNAILIEVHWGLSVFIWLLLPTLLVTFAVSFTQWVAPSAAGSGIPEMKTILRGVVLKEYLTWRTLVAKIVGLSAVIGAGLPLGKEGPVMHMASIVATLLSKLLRIIKGTVENEQRTTDLLAAACTMGVSVCHAAPVGGVLFSIEVTTTYFAVRNYWRGFFAAVVGALFYRLLAVWLMGLETIYPLIKVSHDFFYPYDVIELFPFICVAIVNGFIGAAFVFCHRRYVMFMRHNKIIKKVLMKNRILYPIIVAVSISIVTYPDVLGHYMASTLTSKQQLLQIFSNVTWGQYGSEASTARTEAQQAILDHWITEEHTSFQLSLLIFAVITLMQIGLSSTLPVASGLLVPLMKVGAAFGRMVGELMVSLYPDGIVQGYPIIPGAYAMVGAASFCSSITHTISVSVIVFELTGQITYVIPMIIGVLVSNGISSLLQPSIFNSVIRIKKLPYLPDIVTTTSSDVYTTFVEDIMVTNISYIWYSMTYAELKKVLKENRRIKFFPLVDGHKHMVLLGSVKRIELVRLLLNQISPDKRRKEAQRRQIEELKQRWLEEDASDHPQSRIRYEDEVRAMETDHTINDSTISGGLLQMMGRSFSRSLSQSKSNASRPRPTMSGQRSSVGDEAFGADEGTYDNQLTIHSSTSTAKLGGASPPASPPAHIRDIFAPRNGGERRSSRFSVSKVDAAQKSDSTSDLRARSIPIIAVESDFSDDDKSVKSLGNAAGHSGEAASQYSDKQDRFVKKDSSSEQEQKAPSKSPFKLIQNKYKDKKSKPKDVKQPDPKESEVEKVIFSAARRASAVKRSNSLDSLRRRNQKSEEEDSNSAGQPADRQEDDQDSAQSTPAPDRKSSPVKGILKRRNSFSLGSMDTAQEQQLPDGHYQTIGAADTKLRGAFEKMRKIKMDTAVSMEMKLSQISLFRPKKKKYPVKRQVVDLTDQEREEWEYFQLAMEVDFEQTTIDPAPFQLVERTSLLRVHSLFSLLGINHAYVTNIGRLKGVVALKELRLAIEGTQEKQRQKPVEAPNAAPNGATTPPATEEATIKADSETTTNLTPPSKRTSHIAIRLNSRMEGVHDDPESGLVNRWSNNNIRHHDNGRMS